MDDLIDLTNTLFDFQVQLDDEHFLVGLPRFLGELQGEARFADLLSDLEFEHQRSLNTFKETDQSLMEEIRQLWSEHKETLVAAGLRNLDALEAFGQRFDEEEFHFVDSWDEPDVDPSASKHLLAPLRRWTEEALANESGRTGSLGQLCSSVEQLSIRHRHAYRQFWSEGRTLAGWAYSRLTKLSSRLNPLPSSLEDSVERFQPWSEINELRDFLFGSRGDGDRDGRDKILHTWAAGPRRDIDVLRGEMTRRIILGRSRLGIVRRFAARCERYERQKLLSEATKNRSRAEAFLTKEFARFLFDQGLNPMVDPKIADLRPDILDPHLGQPIYVEAKQYSGNAPKSLVLRGIGQSLDTWGALRQTYRLDEAFLIIFRLDGPRVEFPDVIPFPGRQLYLVLADIASIETTGSRQRKQPIRIGLSEIIELEKQLV